MRPPTGNTRTPGRSCSCGTWSGYGQNMGKLCLRHSEVLEEPVVETVQFTHECVEFSLVCSVLCTQTRRWRLFCRRLNTNKSNKRSRISRRLLYAAIIDDALRWLRQRDKAVNSFAYRSLFTASLSPDVNATADGKISRRAIYRRNNA